MSGKFNMGDKPTDEFTLHLVSSASMEIFPENTLASFTNVLGEEISLIGDWRVALTEIIFPSYIKNVTDTLITVFRGDDHDNREVPAGFISKQRQGNHLSIKSGTYEKLDDLIKEISATGDIEIKHYVDQRDGHLELRFEKDEGITFSSRQIPSILGFKGVQDGDKSIHVGYKQLPEIWSYITENKHRADYPVDMSAGTQLLFVYIDIITHQLVGNTKAPLLRVIDTNRRLKNGSLSPNEPTHRKNFSTLEYKKLLTTTIQSVKVELRTETGKLVPFVGIGKVLLALRFKKFD